MLNKKRYAMAVLFSFVGSVSVLMFQNMDVTNSTNQFDIMLIPKQGLSKVEVHTLYGYSNYQTEPLNIQTPMGPAAWQMSAQDMAGNGSRDLVGVLTGQTGSGFVEVHSLSEASMYQNFDWHLATGKPSNQVLPNSQFEFVDWGGHGGKPDLAYIIKSGSGTHKVELHVYSAASNYKNLLWEGTTAFGDVPSNFIFRFVDWGHHGGIPDLVGIFTTGTGSNRVEIHGASSSSGFQSMPWNYSSGLAPDTNADFRFFMRGHTDSSNPDLVAVRTKNCGSNRVEVHILNGSTAFMQFELQIATASGQIDANWDVSLMTSQSSALSTVANLDANAAINWLTKSVCADGGNNATNYDPYPACPLGTHIRKIAASENLPYFNFDGAYSEWDNYPLPVTDYGGRQMVINARQTVFNGNFDHVFRSEDSFDIYVLNPGGYVAGASTRDGGGYNTTFFGPGGQDYDGWVDFPYSNFLSGGNMNLANTGVYWQQSGGNYSPTTSMAVNKGQEYQSWDYQPSHTFRTGKNMATIRSAHGYEKNVWDPVNHYWHIETFYYTREYGVTRWEAWYPVSALGKMIPGQTKPLSRVGTTDNPSGCGTVPDITYSAGAGFATDTYFVQSCADTSEIKQATPMLPIYPVPNTNMNLITNANFNSMSNWATAGSITANVPAPSTVARDVQYNSHGVNYLKLQCGSSSSCAGPYVFQNIPMSQFKSGHVAYGVVARTEGANSTGTFDVVMMQFNDANQLLWEDSFTTGQNGVPIVKNYQGTYPNDDSGGSPVLASGFFSKKISNVPILGTYMQIRIVPHGNVVFDIPQVWVGPW